MPSLDDTIDLIVALPEVTEGTRYGNQTWFIKKKGFDNYPAILVQLDRVDRSVLADWTTARGRWPGQSGGGRFS